MPAVLGIQAQRFVPFVRGLILRMWSHPPARFPYTERSSVLHHRRPLSLEQRSLGARSDGWIGWLARGRRCAAMRGRSSSVVLYFLLPTMLIDRHDSILEGRKEGGSMEHGIMR